MTVVTVAMLLWQSHRPQVVSVIQPTLTPITESLATTGRVSGTMETLVGAPASGIMDRLLVREGDRVTAGEQLAILKNNVAEAQVAQAHAALNTVRAQFAQVARAPLHSDIATAAEQVQQARLRTVQTGARSEDIQVARERVEEAEHALHVTRQQATNAMVTASFAGTVTAIYAEVGQTVGAQGVLKLVSRDVEIRVDVDESHLADLSAGQEVMLSSSTFRDSIFRGTVSKIAAAVDEARGTVTVTIVPIAPPDWLRPGQTVHVNIITHPAVQRLLVPPQRSSGSGIVVGCWSLSTARYGKRR